MKYRRLGRTGLEVSPVCLGTVNFGWLTEPQEAFEVMTRALDLGINFFDTANSYNHAQGESSSENIVGAWLRQEPGRRRKVVLATKVYRRLGDRPNQGGLSALHIREACEDSLRRLGTDYIDLYQLHHVDRTTPWEEVWQALEHLITAGKVIYVGSSNFAAWHLATFHRLGCQRNLFGLSSEQSVYNLSQRWVELEVLPACRGLGLGFLAYSPLAGGILAGAGGGSGRRRSLPEVVARRRELARPLRRYRSLCHDLGLAQAAVAMAWLLSRPGLTAVVAGPRTPAQLAELVAALEVELSPEMLRRLDEIWPGLGGEAPEAYAW